ncbi:DUF1801 domain-containing protein [Roseobacter litoralis]|uniref:DUF1801 domain-containing protein n=1 Tax=Roseobacter litoralis TaxID=42443 RepID=UPI002491C7A1|nr:DUF1801 domain-containing protein [Roseobacter litoralis]
MSGAIPPLPAFVEQRITVWPRKAKDRFHDIRAIVLGSVADAQDVNLIETLKWGQPAWHPDKPKVGSTLRLAWQQARPNQIGMFVNCNTTLADTMRSLYPTSFEHQGKRALYLPLDAPLPEQAIAHCAVLTLTYHRKNA